MKQGSVQKRIHFDNRDVIFSAAVVKFIKATGTHDELRPSGGIMIRRVGCGF
jgi:hypothetical protein